jgi:hypothetical protein
MANFAQIKNNIVVDVIVVSNADCGDLPFPESEPVGQAFIASCNITGLFLQTSYNGNFRGIYAGIGDTYDSELDEFVPPPAPELPIEE